MSECLGLRNVLLRRQTLGLIFGLDIYRPPCRIASGSQRSAMGRNVVPKSLFAKDGQPRPLAVI
jgi:hypothetical protein